MLQLLNPMLRMVEKTPTRSEADDFWKPNDIDYDIEWAEKEAEKARAARVASEKLERSAPSTRFINLATVKLAPLRTEIVGEAVLFNLHSGIKPAWGESRIDCRLLVKPGAFSESLELGLPIPLLVNHKGEPIASTRDGSLELLETSRGLSIRARPYGNAAARAAVASIRSGKCSEMSFTHNVNKANIEWTSYKGLPCVVLHEAELIDVAICKKGAFTGPTCWLTEGTYRKGDMNRC